MMTWALIISLFTYTGYSTVSVAVFSSKELCEEAKVEFEKTATWGNTDKVKTVCVKAE